MTGVERDAIQKARERGDSDGDIRAMLEKMRGLDPGTLKAIPPMFGDENEKDDPTAQAHGPYGEGQRVAPDQPVTVPTSPENVGKEDEPFKRPDSYTQPAPDATRQAEQADKEGRSRRHIPVEDRDKLPAGQPVVAPTEADPEAQRRAEQEQREAAEAASRQAQREARQQQRQEDKK